MGRDAGMLDSWLWPASSRSSSLQPEIASSDVRSLSEASSCWSLVHPSKPAATVSVDLVSE